MNKFIDSYAYWSKHDTPNGTHATACSIENVQFFFFFDTTLFELFHSTTCVRVYNNIRQYVHDNFRALLIVRPTDCDGVKHTIDYARQDTEQACVLAGVSWSGWITSREAWQTFMTAYKFIGYWREFIKKLKYYLMTFSVCALFSLSTCCVLFWYGICFCLVWMFFFSIEKWTFCCASLFVVFIRLKFPALKPTQNFRYLLMELTCIGMTDWKQCGGREQKLWWDVKQV